MTEHILAEYFAGNISTAELSENVKGSQVRNGHDSISIHVEPMDSVDGFEIQKDHLIRLCEDVISGSLPFEALNTIASALMFSDFFYWNSSSSQVDDIVETTLFSWDNPGITVPITHENMLLWLKYLKTGEYAL